MYFTGIFFQVGISNYSQIMSSQNLLKTAVYQGMVMQTHAVCK